MNYQNASKRRGRGRGTSMQQLSSSAGRHEKRWRVGAYNELRVLQHKVPARIATLSLSEGHHQRASEEKEEEEEEELGIFDHVLGSDHPAFLARMRSVPVIAASWPPPQRDHFFSGDIVPRHLAGMMDTSEDKNTELSEKMIKDLVSFTIECSRTIPLAYRMDPMAVPRFLGSLPQRELYEHQKSGTLFIRQRLQQGLGCIENDDMRMAKTGTVLNSLWEQNKERIGHGIPRFSKPDLIVCPIGVVHVWVEELLYLVGPGIISVCVLTTETQPHLPVPIVTNPIELTSLFDIIITTYSTMVQQHLNQGILYRLQYNTVVYDEAHELRTTTTQRYKAAQAIQTQTRICVSGTIFVNHADDVRSLFKLIGVPETADFHTEAGLRSLLSQWCISRKEEEEKQEKKKKKKEKKNPRGLLEDEEDIDALFNGDDDEEEEEEGITYKTNETYEYLDWVHPIEKEIYEHASHSFVQRYNPDDLEKKKNAGLAKKTLSEIHYLRQLCNSPFLIQEELQSGKSALGLAPNVVFYKPPAPPPDPTKKHRKKKKKEGEEVPVPPPPPLPPRVIFEDLARRATFRLLQTQALGGDMHAVERSIKAELATMTDPSVLEHYWVTLWQHIQHLHHHMVPPVCTKEQRVVNYVRDVVEPRGEKAVVFSYWAKEVKHLYQIFLERLKPVDQGGIKGAKQVRMVSGKIKPEDREAIWEEFQTNPDVAILLVSLQTGSVGIDLTAANHVLIMDLWWNPQVVKQAVSRVKGRKQKRDIHILYLIVRGTVDEDVLALAAEKLAHGNRLFQKSSSDVDEILPAVEELRNTIRVARAIIKRATTPDIVTVDMKSVSAIEEEEEGGGGDPMDTGD